MAKRKDFSNLSRSQRNRRLNESFESTSNWTDEPPAATEFHVVNVPRADDEEYNNDINNANDNSEPRDDEIVTVPDTESSDDTEIELSMNSSSDIESDSSTETPLRGARLRQRLAEWACDHSVDHKTSGNLLRILKIAGLSELPTDSRTLLQTPRDTPVSNMEPGKYFHYGLRRALTDQLKIIGTKLVSNEIHININIDGLPIAKSSKSQLWPILGEIFPKADRPFVIGAYHGHAKPGSVSEFLKNFVDEYELLHNEGFEYLNRKYRVTIRAIICDTPARAFVTSTKSHNGYFGCGKCTQEGEWRNNRMLFLELDAPLRNDQDFVRRVNEDFHTGNSPFEATGIGMISQFPLDYMHLVCLGVMKKLLRELISGYHAARLSGEMIKQLSADIKEIAKSVPVEFVRKGRGLDELDRWKATEFRLFLLYGGLVILKKYLPTANFIHFCSFNCAIRILCHPTDCFNNNAYAAELLKYFAKEFGKLYGEDSMIYNVHNLIHLSRDAEEYGHLDSFSAFPFENYLYTIKKSLRKGEKPLAQLHNRIVERAACSRKKKSQGWKWPRISKSNGRVFSTDSIASHDKVEFERFILILTKVGNDCCYLQDGTVARIKDIGLKNEKCVLEGQILVNSSSFNDYPCCSKLMNIVIGNEWSEVVGIEASDIKAKAVVLPYEGSYCFLPLLHTCI